MCSYCVQYSTLTVSISVTNVLPSGGKSYQIRLGGLVKTNKYTAGCIKKLVKTNKYTAGCNKTYQEEQIDGWINSDWVFRALGKSDWARLA